jgi:hypothetical protein
MAAGPGVSDVFRFVIASRGLAGGVIGLTIWLGCLQFAGFEEIAAFAAIEEISSISTIMATFHPFPSIVDLIALTG